MLTELQDPEKVFGSRKSLTFLCGACTCAFSQELRDIKFYDKGRGVHRYIVQTECPSCHGIVAVTTDGTL